MKRLLWMTLFGLLVACGSTSSPTAGSTADLVDEAIDAPVEVVEQVESESEPAVTAVPQRADLPDLGRAPDITNNIWLNTDTPLTLSDQRGKVVLVEFWTFG